MENFTYYTDPGHGWVEVPRSLLHELGIADKITGYSYQRGEDVFLEEDCDLSTFARAMTKAGRSFDLTSKVLTSPGAKSWVRMRLLWSYECEVQA
jgi:hypothetical protein